MSDDLPPTLWTRLVADERFREDFIADPLRALGATTPVAVSSEQVQQFDAMDVDERRTVITEIVREAYIKGGAARFGPWGPDGRLGGPTPPEREV